jgi:hypothetical protein
MKVAFQKPTQRGTMEFRERGVSLLCETEKYGSGSLAIKGGLGSVPYWTYII